MRKAVVLATSPGREVWKENFISKSIIMTTYPTIIVEQSDYELGAIMKALREHPQLEEFIFLHDTCEIKHQDLYRFCFEKHAGKSVSFSDHPSPIGMYLGKYRREILEKMDIKIPQDKWESVEMEITFPKEYVKLDPVVYIPQPLRDGNNFVTKYGRVNMKLENDWLVKYKSTWSRSMLKDYVDVPYK